MFNLSGVVLAAWTLVAFAIGALAGMLIRRVVPAIAATLAAWPGLAITTATVLRQHYLTPLASSNPNPSLQKTVWIISQWYTQGGKPVSQSVISQVLQGDPLEHAGPNAVRQAVEPVKHLAQHGYTS